MEFETYQSWVRRARGAWFQANTFLQVQTQVFGSKSEQDFWVSVFSFGVVSKFVMFVQYPQWNFLSFRKWAIINFLNMPSQDTLHGFEMKLWLKENLFICRTKHLDSNLLLLVWKIFINLGDNISEAFKGRHLFMWSHRKPELRKNKWPRLFKNGCHWNTNGNENLHVPVAWTAVYLVKLRLKDFWKISVSFFSAQR